MQQARDQVASKLVKNWPKDVRSTSSCVANFSATMRTSDADRLVPVVASWMFRAMSSDAAGLLADGNAGASRDVIDFRHDRRNRLNCSHHNIRRALYAANLSVDFICRGGGLRRQSLDL